jgi:hypothetical protein
MLSVYAVLSNIAKKALDAGLNCFDYDGNYGTGQDLVKGGEVSKGGDYCNALK